MNRRIKILTRAQLIVLIIFTCAGQFSISITHICGFLGSGLWLYKTHATRSWNQLRWPLWIPFAGFALASILAVITALDPLSGSRVSGRGLVRNQLLRFGSGHADLFPHGASFCGL
jgi:hypothetical protein